MGVTCICELPSTRLEECLSHLGRHKLRERLAGTLHVMVLLQLLELLLLQLLQLMLTTTGAVELHCLLC